MGWFDKKSSDQELSDGMLVAYSYEVKKEEELLSPSEWMAQQKKANELLSPSEWRAQRQAERER